MQTSYILLLRIKELKLELYIFYFKYYVHYNEDLTVNLKNMNEAKSKLFLEKLCHCILLLKGHY